MDFSTTKSRESKYDVVPDDALEILVQKMAWVSGEGWDSEMRAMPPLPFQNVGSSRDVTSLKHSRRAFG